MIFWKAVDRLGSVFGYALVLIISAIFSPHMFFLSFGIMLILVISFSYLMKWCFALPRPGKEKTPRPRIWSFREVDAYGFPSNHAALAGGLVAVLWFFSLPWFLLAALWFVLTVAGRLVLRKHDVGDIVAGMVIGVLLGMLALRLAFLL